MRRIAESLGNGPAVLSSAGHAEHMGVVQHAGSVEVMSSKRGGPCLQVILSSAGYVE